MALIGARRRKPVNSHGILVTLKVIAHGIVKNYTTLFPHYVYMGDVTGMVNSSVTCVVDATW